MDRTAVDGLEVFAEIHAGIPTEVVAAAAPTSDLLTAARAAVFVVVATVTAVALLLAAAFVVAMAFVVVMLTAAGLLFANATANDVALVAGRIKKEHINTSERICKERIGKVPTLLAYSRRRGSVTNKPKENA